MPTIAFITFGCKINQYETQVMREIARQNNYEVVPEYSSSDVYVVNTCTVTHSSDRKARKIIRKILKQYPDAKVLVTGCYAERDGENIRKVEGVDLVFGNDDKSCFAEYLLRLENPNTNRCYSEYGRDVFLLPPSAIDEGCTPKRHLPPLGITSFDGQTRALVKVQDGCNAFCTYCIVPYVRGRSFSRPIDDIIKEICTLAKNGYKEIVITGVHLGAYGKDICNRVTLADLLEQIHPIDGIERIRLSSIEPMDVPDDLIGRAERLSKLAPHFHLPLQSGNNEILKRMGRQYTVEEYTRLVEQLRATFADVGITTDIMVGFPGENDSQFNDTYNFIKAIGFSRLHVFRYSQRKGTPAVRWEGQVPYSVSTYRSEEIRKLGDRLAKEFHLEKLGKESDVLIEDSREGKEKLLAGFTGNYIRVLMNVPDSMVNQMVRVKLTDIEDKFVRGELVKKKGG